MLVHKLYSKFFLSCLKEIFDENLNKHEIIYTEITIVKFYVYIVHTSQDIILSWVVFFVLMKIDKIMWIIMEKFE